MTSNSEKGCSDVLVPSIQRNTLFFKRYLFIYFLEREREGEREREKNINVWLPLVCHLLGTWHTTQAVP